MTRLLIVDNSIHADFYDPVLHWTRAMDAPFATCRPPAGRYPDDPGAFTHVLVTGSEDSITQDDEWILRTCDLVRDAAARGLPVLGSCFGHQLVVRALSGKGFVRTSPTPEFGWVEVTRSREGDADPVASRLPSPFFAFAAHFDEVWPLPQDWATLATSSRCDHAIVKWRGGPVWGVQHHPEIAIDEGRHLLDGEMRVMPDRCSTILAAFQREPRDSMVTRALMEAFLDLGPRTSDL
jgi:GMP synthase-like glutamine amidotransferase